MIRLYLLHITCMIVILAADVERNPGPINTELNPDFSILHLNIRSISNKLEYIKDNFLDFDILCLTDSHVTSTINDEMLLLEGFLLLYRRDSTTHSSCILVFVSEKFRKTEFDHPFINAIWIEAKTSYSTFLICCVYRYLSTPFRPFCFYIG